MIWILPWRFPTGFIGIRTTLYGIANIAESGCTMKVGILDGQFGVHKTKKGRMLEHECAWTKCFLIYQELRKTCLNDDYDCPKRELGAKLAGFLRRKKDVSKVDIDLIRKL